MLCSLSDLDTTCPCMRSKFFLAIITLDPMDNILDLKGLLQKDSAIDLFPYSQFYSNSLGVFFGPSKGSVHKLYMFQASYFLKTNC